MAALRTAWSLAGSALGARPWLDLTSDERLDQALALAAIGPALVAATHREGSRPKSPTSARSWRRPSLALSGPLHGGALSRALEMLDDIGTPDRAEAWLRGAVADGQRIMGFGHRVYRTEDPRARLLRETARELGGPRIELALEVEATARRVLCELKPDRVLNVNVEYHAAVVMEAVGLPPALFTPTFAVSRAIGWTAHAIEQMDGNRILRPSSRYTGPAPVRPLPVAAG